MIPGLKRTCSMPAIRKRHRRRSGSSEASVVVPNDNLGSTRLAISPTAKCPTSMARPARDFDSKYPEQPRADEPWRCQEGNNNRLNFGNEKQRALSLRPTALRPRPPDQAILQHRID